MKLIKINTDHYVIVDDSEIKEGDWYISYMSNKILQRNKLMDIVEVMDKKITHSTQPLDSKGYWGKVMPLTLTISEIKELIGEVDVDKKAIKDLESYFGSNLELTDSGKDWVDGYGIGYNQCLEDNKDKKYTEEDLRKAWDSGREYANDYWEARGEKYMINFDNFIQSIQPKTEWEVEIIDGKLKLK